MRDYLAFLGVVISVSVVYAANLLPATSKETKTEISKESKKEKVNISEKTANKEADDRWRGSLMYSTKEIKWIHDAIKAHDLDIPLDILLPGMFTRDSQKKSLSKAQGLAKATPGEEKKNDLPLPDITQDTTLYVYLNSIVYIAKDDWLVWIGSKKLTPKENDPLFTIVDVTQDRIVVLWPNFPLDKLPTSWKEGLIAMEDSLLLSNGKSVMVNTETKSLAFVLKPNQTFVGSQVDVLEGSVTPKKAEAVAVPTRATPSLPGGNVLDDAPVLASDIAENIEKEAARIEKNKRMMQLKKYYQEQLTMLSSLLKKK